MDPWQECGIGGKGAGRIGGEDGGVGEGEGAQPWSPRGKRTLSRSSSSCFTVGNWDPQESRPWIPSWRSLRVQIQASQSQG